MKKYTVTFDTKRIGANTVIVKAGNKYMKVVLY